MVGGYIAQVSLTFCFFVWPLYIYLVAIGYRRANGDVPVGSGTMATSKAIDLCSFYVTFFSLKEGWLRKLTEKMLYTPYLQHVI